MIQRTWALVVATVVVLGGVVGAVVLWAGSDKAEVVRALPADTLARAALRGPAKDAADGQAHDDTRKVLAESSRRNTYTVLYFHTASRPGAQKTARQAASIVSKLPQPVAWTVVDVEDPSAQPVLAKYGIRSEPMTLMLAPNGAVTTGFAGAVSAEALERGFVSPKMAEVLQAIQAEQIVFLAFVGPEVAESDAVRRATQQAAAEMTGISRTIEIDPRDPAEEQLLSQCEVSPASKLAETLVISPRGAIVQRFKGAMTPRHLFDSIQRILAQESGCGS
ncbi:hypothetical protein LCGC14_2584490, partial [marine sediment metagenome]